MTFEQETQIWLNVSVKKVTMQFTRINIHTKACNSCKITKAYPYLKFGQNVLFNVSVNSTWIHLLPGNPRETFFDQANPDRLGNFFHLIPLPRGKNDGRIPGVRAEFSQTRRNCSLSLQNILKKTTRQHNFFLFGELNKTFIL